MKNVRDMLVIQVRLFPVDTMPPIEILEPMVSEKIGNAYGFQGYGDGGPLLRLPPLPQVSGSPGPPNTLDFQSGTFSSEDAETLFVNSLLIERRRIVLQVAGTSEQADCFFESLRSLISEAYPQCAPGLSKVLYKAEETACTVDLDFQFTQLFHPATLTFIETGVAGAASGTRVRASAVPSGFRSRVSYDVTDQYMRDHGISFNSQDFIIEPRHHTPLQDKIFFTRSPLSSQKHLGLLREFESLVSAQETPSS